MTSETRQAKSGDQREPARAEVLRPGIALPLMGYLWTCMAAVAMVIFVIVDPVITQTGHPPLTKNDWDDFPMRVFAGETWAAITWLFYKLASNKIILRAGNADILTWGIRWRIGRDEVADVTLGASALTIELTDGCKIRPSMFWRNPSGVIFFHLGLFKNAMSAQDIQRKILNWRAPSPCPSQASRVRSQAGAGRRYWPCRRHWTLRVNGWMLVILTVIVLLESTIVTLFAGTS